MLADRPKPDAASLQAMVHGLQSMAQGPHGTTCHTGHAHGGQLQLGALQAWWGEEVRVERKRIHQDHGFSEAMRGLRQGSEVQWTIVNNPAGPERVRTITSAGLFRLALRGNALGS